MSKSESRILQGDCREVLAGLPEQSVQCVVTSPPYFGLRDYGVDGQMGLEDTLDEYLANQVSVFLAVRRLLRDDGTLWLNMGDAYASSTQSGTQGQTGQRADRTFTAERIPAKPCLPSKNLIGLPWRLAFALQESGWYLRSDIIWHKPNPMPESVTDRPTKSHEYIFLMTKKPRYFYDAEAVREPHTTLGPNIQEHKWDEASRPKVGDGPMFRTRPGSRPPNCIGHALGRNLRTVWKFPTQGCPGAHFAVFPENLPEICIRAGTSDKGCCPVCGAGWRRVVERDRHSTRPGRNNVNDPTGMANRDTGRHVTDVHTVGWEPGCECGSVSLQRGGATGTIGNGDMAISHAPIPCAVLDPYCGSGTTGVVAKALGRSFIGIELNPEYCDMARDRIRNPRLLPPVPEVEGQMSLIDDA